MTAVDDAPRRTAEAPPEQTRLQGLRALLVEGLQFAFVGALATVVDVGLFNVFRGMLHGEPLLAKGFSTTVAAVVSYLLNRVWTWRDRAYTGVGRELTLFLVLSAVGLGINEGVLAASHYGLGLRSALADNVAGNVVGLGAATVWRFWSFRRWVFLPESPPSRQVAMSLSG